MRVTPSAPVAGITTHWPSGETAGPPPVMKVNLSVGWISNRTACTLGCARHGAHTITAATATATPATATLIQTHRALVAGGLTTVAPERGESLTSAITSPM